MGKKQVCMLGHAIGPWVHSHSLITAVEKKNLQGENGISMAFNIFSSCNLLLILIMIVSFL